MTIKIFWCTNLENVQVYQIVQKWTLEEVYDALREGYLMSKDVEKFIIIYDLSMAQGIPKNLLSSVNHMSKLHQDNVELRLVVSNHSFVRTLYSIIVKIQPKLAQKVIFVDTLDDAIIRIQGFRDNSSSN